MTGIDIMNSRILSVLEKDGRISNIDLAAKVGLSASACLRRVQDLERSGVIKGYRAVIDRAAIGGSITIFVTVGLSGQLKTHAQDFERAMEATPHVKECHNITGSVEYLLRVEVQDLATYKEFHGNVLGSLSQVGSITSHICLGSSKDVRDLV